MSRHRALLLDAFGTLITVDRPAERLRASLAARLGTGIAPESAETAMRDEMRHYQANCRRASDAASLAELRRECAAIVMDRCGVNAPEEAALAVLSDAVVIRAYDDAPPALEMARRRALATAVVSNGDCSMPSLLEQAGLRVDVVVDSATAGAAKPDPAIFHRALHLLDVAAAQALHVGDHEELDGAGARAAGIDVVIIDRSGSGGPGRIASLAELDSVLA
jgi:putative hydrolase of the HAD superfamily